MVRLFRYFLFWGVFTWIVYCPIGKSSLRTNIPDFNKSVEEDNMGFKIKLPAIHFPYNNLGPLSTDISTGGIRDEKLIYNIHGIPEDHEIGLNYMSHSIFPSLLNAIYLFSSVCFIFCLRGLSDHKTSRRGNLLGCVGIVTAILVTFNQVGFGFRYGLFAIIIIPAIILGYYIAKSVSMVQMPQLVALFHGFVGLAALLVSFSKFHSFSFLSSEMNTLHLLELFVGTFIAAITFTGSLVAAGKLSEVLENKSLKLKAKKLINVVSIVLITTLGYYFINSDVLSTKTACLYTSLVIELFLGFHLTASIGGGDMPVVISVLNSYSGFSTAINGFLLNNSLLITSGSLIGSSGAILSYIMCVGMNRHIGNIILGGWDDEESIEYVKEKQSKKDVNTITSKFVADAIINAKKVVIIPGYGVAVSKCQRELADIANILKAKKVDVVFAIHPVAGRMPGHLNVLLAEANVPYQIVKEMEDVNPTIATADIILVVGANDIVNPSTYDASSKIYGMPVIEAWKGKKVVVLKRSLATGYSHIDNPLFYYPNTYILFGDAKLTTNQILNVLNDYITHKSILETVDTKKVGSIEMMEKQSEAIPELDDSSSTDNVKDKIDEEEYPKARKILGLIRGEEKYETDSTPGTSNTILVPLTPKFIPRLKKMGFRVLVEMDIGTNILIYNEEYLKFGAELSTRENILKACNIIIKVDPPTPDLINEISDNTVFISYIWPGINQTLLESMVRNKQKQNITFLAIDEVPRSTRAQKLDIRSSMSNLQGYRAILEAFFILPKFSKSSTTAAGKIKPAKVFVIGAGVAGLQAIVTAKSLGAIVFAHDTRLSTEEEIKSCGGIFIKVPKVENKSTGPYATTMSEEYNQLQKQIFKKVIKRCDVVICSASIPGKTSPKLVTTDMIKLMKPGSVAVDLATEFGDKENNWGGNIECSQSNKNIIVNGVHILGRDKIERNMPIQASDLFSMNIINLLEEMGGGLQFNVDMNNDIIKSLVVVKNGIILYNASKTVEKLDKSESVFAIKKEDIFDDSEDVIDISEREKDISKGPTLIQRIFASDAFFFLSLFAILVMICIFGSFLSIKDLHHVSLFVFSLIIGYHSVWSVTPALHTPLISVTNALSGVIIIGSMIEYGSGIQELSTFLSAIATFLAALNLSGGFYVTKRMLDMFSK